MILKLIPLVPKQLLVVKSKSNTCTLFVTGSQDLHIKIVKCSRLEKFLETWHLSQDHLKAGDLRKKGSTEVILWKLESWYICGSLICIYTFFYIIWIFILLFSLFHSQMWLGLGFLLMLVFVYVFLVVYCYCVDMLKCAKQFDTEKKSSCKESNQSSTKNWFIYVSMSDFTKC